MVRCGRVAAFYFAKTRGSGVRRVSCNGLSMNRLDFADAAASEVFPKHILWQLTWRRWPPKCSLRRPIPADPMGAPIAAVSAQTSRRFLDRRATWAREGLQPRDNRNKKRRLPKQSSPMEAPPGFEPGSKGFADLCLTSWLWRHRPCNV